MENRGTPREQELKLTDYAILGVEQRLTKMTDEHRLLGKEIKELQQYKDNLRVKMDILSNEPVEGDVE